MAEKVIIETGGIWRNADQWFWSLVKDGKSPMLLATVVSKKEAAKEVIFCTDVRIDLYANEENLRSSWLNYSRGGFLKNEDFD